MNACALASRAAAYTSSSEAPGFPKRMFSMMVVPNSTGSCGGVAWGAAHRKRSDFASGEAILVKPGRLGGQAGMVQLQVAREQAPLMGGAPRRAPASLEGWGRGMGGPFSKHPAGRRTSPSWHHPKQRLSVRAHLAGEWRPAAPSCTVWTSLDLQTPRTCQSPGPPNRHPSPTWLASFNGGAAFLP